MPPPLAALSLLSKAGSKEFVKDLVRQTALRSASRAPHPRVVPRGEMQNVGKRRACSEEERRGLRRLCCDALRGVVSATALAFAMHTAGKHGRTRGVTTSQYTL